MSNQSASQSEPMAVLFGYDPATGEHTADPLIGLRPESGMDPITWAHLLKESVEGDFPGWLWSITGNQSAHDLRGQALIDSIRMATDVEEATSSTICTGSPFGV